MTKKAYLGVDLGAESGRVIVGTIDNGRLEMHVAHRFTHEPTDLPTGLYWNTTGIWQGVLVGSAAASARRLVSHDARAQSGSRPCSATYPLRKVAVAGSEG